MSLLTTLAYAITAAVRPRVRDAEVAALKAQIDDLNRQAYERECRISDLNRQLLVRQIKTYRPVDMQNFGQALEDYVRNCTPGRHELFVRD
jgi:hypothetical protein